MNNGAIGRPVDRAGDASALRAYDAVGKARTSIGRYLDFYNRRRPHSSLDGATPDQAYFNALPLRLAA
jgi:putative transposase